MIKQLIKFMRARSGHLVEQESSYKNESRKYSVTVEKTYKTKLYKYWFLMRCRPDSIYYIDRDRAEVNVGIIRLTSHYSQCLNSQQLFNYIPNKSENATLQLSIFCEKVLDKKYLLRLYNVSLTSSKWFVETSPICLFWCLSYAPLSV